VLTVVFMCVGLAGRVRCEMMPEVWPTEAGMRLVTWDGRKEAVPSLKETNAKYGERMGARGARRGATAGGATCERGEAPTEARGVRRWLQR